MPVSTMVEGRTAAFARNERLDEAIAELATLLGPAERSVTPRRTPRQPTVLVLSGPRSASTVALQLLAASGAFAYPTNLLSRFASTPALGARIQRILCDPSLAYREELHDIGRPVGFDSALGKSDGALQPNEFWSFWRRFVPITDPRRLRDDELAAVDHLGLLSSLAAMEEVDPRPFAMKAMLLQQDVPALDRWFERLVLVDVRRRPLFQMQSILEARRAFFGHDRTWWSVSTPDRAALEGLSPHHQVAGQVLALRRRLDETLPAVAPGRRVEISYDRLCAAPGELVDAVGERLVAQGARAVVTGRLPDRLPTTDTCRLPVADLEALAGAWVELGGAPDLVEVPS